jgi:hypothetical protein
MSDNLIHDVVRNRYGAIARAAETTEQAVSCCGPSTVSTAATDNNACCGDDGCGSGAGLYNMEMLEGLPVDVTNLSLGCEGPQFTRSNALYREV